MRSAILQGYLHCHAWSFSDNASSNLFVDRVEFSCLRHNDLCLRIDLYHFMFNNAYHIGNNPRVPVDETARHI